MNEIVIVRRVTHVGVLRFVLRTWLLLLFRSDDPQPQRVVSLRYDELHNPEHNFRTLTLFQSSRLREFFFILLVVQTYFVFMKLFLQTKLTLVIGHENYFVLK